MKPVVYTQRVEEVQAYQERRDCGDQRIAAFLHACGFLPIPLPNRAQLVSEFIQVIHPQGIVLTGGNSLTAYGGNAPERDEMDRALLQSAVENRIPLYGFCRGMQSILDYFGNTLSEVEGHAALRHQVQWGQQRYEVNSYHNQGCFHLKEQCGLCVLAKAKDGVIEAVRHETLPIAGTMWHPERETVYNKQDMKRLQTLLEGEVE